MANDMKAVAIESFGEVDQVVHLENLPRPEPAPNEVLIEIAYAGVNPVDWKICKGQLKDSMPHQMPIILGWDCAGTVTQTGRDVKDLKKGDQVFAYVRRPSVHWGSFCQFATCPAEHAVRVPSNLTLAQASTVPNSALTAWQALFDFAQIKRGQTVLIHAGAGGVGSFAIQLARGAGASVYSTASAPNHAYVRKLGADVVIDYNREDFVERIRKDCPSGVDFVLDCVGGDVLTRSFEVCRKGGRLASIVEPPSEALAKQYRVEMKMLLSAPNGKELKEIAELLANGKLQPPEVQEMPLKDAVQALNKSMLGHTRGKITLKVKES